MTRQEWNQHLVDFLAGKEWDGTWVCEQHPNLEWPHDDCAGPGMPPIGAYTICGKCGKVMGAAYEFIKERFGRCKCFDHMKQGGEEG